MQSTSEKRDTSIDALKIMATFAVLKLHVGYRGDAGAILQYICGFAIPIFFMVSGALLLNKPGGVSVKYMIQRIGRILGLMFVWNIMLVALMVVKNKSLMNPFQYILQAMLQKDYFWHFWYLWSLLILTALSPLISRAFEIQSKRKILIMACMLVCFVMSFMTVYEDGRYILEIHIPQTFRLWSHCMYFCIGGAIYRYRGSKCITDLLRKHRGFVFITLGLLSVSVALVQYHICYGTRFSSPEYCFSNPVILLYNVLLFTGIVFLKEISIYRSRIFDALHRDSLGIYILHPFMIIILRRLGIWSLSYSLANFVLMAFSTVVIVECMRRVPYINRLVKL